MRQIVLDTETTGLYWDRGHKIIEIGCVEVFDRRLTGNNYHVYLNPERAIDEEALAVHGLDTDFLSDKPVFADVADELLDYLRGAELIIHNAAFDVGFLDAELKACPAAYGKLEDYCQITDSLALARNIYPGAKNSLDALCKRLEIDNSHRNLHGALLDSELLAEVYLAMTGGQIALGLEMSQQTTASNDSRVEHAQVDLRIQQASEADAQAHRQYLEMLNQKAADGCLWLEGEV